MQEVGQEVVQDEEGSEEVNTMGWKWKVGESQRGRGYVDPLILSENKDGEREGIQKERKQEYYMTESQRRKNVVCLMLGTGKVDGGC